MDVAITRRHETKLGNDGRQILLDTQKINHFSCGTVWGFESSNQLIKINGSWERHHKLLLGYWTLHLTNLDVMMLTRSTFKFA